MKRAKKRTVRRSRKAPAPPPRNRSGQVAEDARLAAICDVTEAMSSSLDLQVVLDRALEKTVEIANADAGAIYLLRDSQLILTSWRGISRASAETLRTFDLHKSRIGEVARTTQPWIEGDLDKQPFTPPAMRREGIRSNVVLPLMAQKRVHGVLIFGARTPRRFQAEDLQLYVAMTRQIGMALENARLHSVALRELAERGRAEDALRGSEHLYRTTIDVLDEWVHLVDRDLRFVYANGAVQDWCRTKGLDPDVVGKHILEIYPFLPASVLDEYREVFETGRPCNTAERTEVDGRAYFTETRKIAVERDRVAHVLTVIRDVTERTRAEEALRASENRFRSLIKYTSDAIFCYEYDPPIPTDLPVEKQVPLFYAGVLAECNEACVRSYGLQRRDEAIGRRLTGLFGTAAGSLDGFFRTFVEHGYRMSDVEGVEHLPDGSRRHFSNSGYGTVVDGKLIRVWGAYRDITEKRQIEDRIRAERAFTDAALDAQADTFFLFDPGTGKALRWNRAFRDIVGYSDEEIAGMPAPASYYSPDDLTRAAAFIQRILTEGTGTIELELLCKDGRKVPTEYHVSVIRDARGEPTQIISIGRDVTARRRAENAMRELSHRLLNAQEEERRRIARDLHDSTAQKLAGLIMGLGRLGETPAGADEAARKPLADCLATAEDCVQEIRSLSHLLHPPLLDELGLEVALDSHLKGLAKQTGIEAELDAPADLGRLPADVELTLFRIVQEGLGNVLKHAGGATAVVQLERLRDHVILEVRDRGRGIPPGLLDRLRNRQAVPGMGIAGMRERLEPLGGRLEIDSSAEGTTVRVFVPVPPERA